jgi:membrane peptidoglycan carboxypeptidase
VAGAVLWVTTDVPSPESVRNPQVSVLRYSDGGVLARTGVEDRTSVPLEQVSLAARQEPGTGRIRASYGGADMSKERRLPSISLGVTAVTPLEQATAYATLAAGGVRAEPFLVERVVDRSGKVLYEAEPQGERVRRGVAADVTFALQQVVERGSGRAAGLSARPAAGKTGTTSGNTAAWLVGYTPRLATAVALFTDGSDSALPAMAGVREVTGGSLPARIWSRYTEAALLGLPVRPFPEPVFGGRDPSPSPVPSPSPAPERGQGPQLSPEPTEPAEPTAVPEPSRPPGTGEPEPTPAPTQEPEPTEVPEVDPTEPPATGTSLRADRRPRG